MIPLNKMEHSEDDQTDMTVGNKLAFIMNAQAEKWDMNKLNADALLEWADQFDGGQSSFCTCRSSTCSTLGRGGRRRSQKKIPTDREINTAVFMLRAKQMGLPIAQLFQTGLG